MGGGLDLIEKARLFAQQKHEGQLCKGASGKPYYEHVASVFQILIETIGYKDSEILAAAYLHDVIEDTNTTQEILAEQFGEGVAVLVQELSDPPNLDEKERRQSQIDHAPLLSKRAKLIKIADKISNLEELERDPPSNWSISQQLAYAAWGEAVFDGLKGLSDGLDTRFRTTIKKVNTKLKPKKMQ
ncbi:MAG: HD domain-containing protein [Alphaproteobacteria bacterium]